MIGRGNVTRLAYSTTVMTPQLHYGYPDPQSLGVGWWWSRKEETFHLHSDDLLNTSYSGLNIKVDQKTKPGSDILEGTFLDHLHVLLN